MRFLWLIFVGLVVGMLAVLPRLNSSSPQPKELAATPREELSSGTPRMAVLTTPRHAELLVGEAGRRDSIVRYALQQLGTPYLYAGTTPETGFDCSGFVQFVYSRFGIPVPHSTALLIDAGQPVPRADARPGDLVVFTGTATTSTTPGHAGIIILAKPGGPIRFVHSSSARRESGVKVSQVEGTDYERRFMQVRRVVLPGKATDARSIPSKQTTR
ncbi:C40 family peptidase [Hymenobacter sp. BT683]|uniref:C40 family peptidase n=1 Tax=Hymenobacter jeongseonensis TaxID=2791027 RepID=A0ABS0IK98_9BACT|nr:C40 family peptidase [Hymenobacter jeongseonensis]MBF9238818.1 C40 family peptidase [Hymenobacter jeongseonensis]